MSALLVGLAASDSSTGFEPAKGCSVFGTNVEVSLIVFAPVAGDLVTGGTVGGWSPIIASRIDVRNV